MSDPNKCMYLPGGLASPPKVLWDDLATDVYHNTGRVALSEEDNGRYTLYVVVGDRIYVLANCLCVDEATDPDDE
jgi:hypothetical protein